MSNGEPRAALGESARAEAPTPARNYGIPRGSSPWWRFLAFRAAMSASILVLVFIPTSVGMRILICVASAGLFVLRYRELRGLEPVRFKTDASSWDDVLARLPVVLRERGYEVRTSPAALEAEELDTFGPRNAFDVMRDEGDVVFLGQRATVQWARRHLGIQRAGPVRP